jgi:hypothetical protein
MKNRQLKEPQRSAVALDGFSGQNRQLEKFVGESRIEVF